MKVELRTVETRGKLYYIVDLTLEKRILSLGLYEDDSDALVIQKLQTLLESIKL